MIMANSNNNVNDDDNGPIFDPIIPFSINWDIPISHAIFIFCISLLISIYPAIKILSLNPIKAMKK